MGQGLSTLTGHLVCSSLLPSLEVLDPQGQTWPDEDWRPILTGPEEDHCPGPHRADCALRRPGLGPEEEQGGEAEGSRSAVQHFKAL